MKKKKAGLSIANVLVFMAVIISGATAQSDLYFLCVDDCPIARGSSEDQCFDQCRHEENFVQCMSNQSSSDTQTFKRIYSSHSPSFFSLLQSKERNTRWRNSTSLRPKFILTPNNYNEIKAAIMCAKALALQIRVRSGGHDYEGLSYRSKSPFVLVDLVNLRSITINMGDETSWVEAGATLGELYYSIAQMSNAHAFPAGLCPTVGVGGHLSGGGMGTLVRKYGLAADNILDAKIMNVKGEILDRESMGEDLFWAIRGGGGASFGVILAWKVKLVRVPLVTTVFTFRRDVDEQGIEVLDKWQRIASKLPRELFIRVFFQTFWVNGNKKPKFTSAVFNSLFLGTAKELLLLMNTKFPELGLQKGDLNEMPWINTTLYFAWKGNQPLEDLLTQDFHAVWGDRMKAKSDFSTMPLPKSVFREFNKRLMEDSAVVIMDPYGGKMDEIGENETPFPYRKGTLFNLLYLDLWRDDGKKHLKWSKDMYEFMKPYVSSSPRGAYLNYRDLDIGLKKSEKAKASYSEAKVWGEKYFKGNFERLAKVKKMVDPDDFFGDEQSIPPFS